VQDVPAHGREVGLDDCYVLAWMNARCPPKPLYHSPSSAGQGRGNMMKGMLVETRTGRDHSPVTVTDKTDSTWGKKKFNLSPIISEQHNEK